MVQSAAECPKVSEWSTPSEETCYRTTPRYEETIAYARRIAAAAPKQVKIEVFGKTGQGRDLVAAVVSADGVFDPVAIHKSGRPVIYIQNAIHAGEMDGKDASLALLRDIAVTKSQAALHSMRSSEMWRFSHARSKPFSSLARVKTSSAPLRLTTSSGVSSTRS